MNLSTVRQALQAAQVRGLERLDAQLLLLRALNRPEGDRAWLLAHDDEVLQSVVLAGFERLGDRRLAGEPFAYISGQKEFFGLNLQVDHRVLVPRPDTETLVSWALEVLQALPSMALRVADLGTGSGAIALALARHLRSTHPDLEVVAVDASRDALDVASSNALRLGMALQFIHGDWLEKVSGHFHLIVSNPPYIAEGDEHLPALQHEPRQALSSGSDGLDDLRQIIAQAPAHLYPDGWLLLEHGYDQATVVRELMKLRGFKNVQHRHDLAGIARCTGGQWPVP